MYICPLEDTSVCTCKLLAECNPLAKLVKAKKYNELKNWQICEFDEFTPKYCCPTPENFKPTENLAVNETEKLYDPASASSNIKVIKAESSPQNGSRQNFLKLGEPQNFRKGLLAEKIVPNFDSFILLTILHKVQNTSSDNLKKTLRS